MVNPKDLPFYEEKNNDQFTYVPQETGIIESNIKIAREGLTAAKLQLSDVGDQMLHIYETGKAHSQGAYSQLLEEDNLPARIGVIAGAGTLGLMFGALRGRIFKRLLYTGLGAGAGAAVCYPIEAAEVGDQAYGMARKNALVAYNFVTGVAEPGAANSPLVSDLIASTIKRASYFLVRKVKELYLALNTKSSSTPLFLTSAPVSVPDNPKVDQTSTKSDTIIPKVGLDPTPVVYNSPENPPKINESAKLVFLEKFESSDKLVEGDDGQSNPEDRDLYSSRG